MNICKLPRATRALVILESPNQRTPLYHDAKIEEKSLPPLTVGEVLVQMRAVSFNRRDLWARLGKQPGMKFGATFGSDGVGIVVASADANDPLLNKRVFLTPMRGWQTHPDAPEERFGILGGGAWPFLGSFAEHVIVERDEVVLAPEHLDDVHLAAWPLAGVTAWRAITVNADVKPGHNVLITGIGGGVALVTMQICLAKGATVYVTSGDDDKIRKSVNLGARAGFNYKQKTWPAQLGALLKGVGDGRPTNELDAIIDSAGGNIFGLVGRYLKPGGRLVCYGMTAIPQIKFTIHQVLKNQKLIGSTMGSRKDLLDSTKFMAEHKIVPVVSHILDGLDSAEEGFELLRRGDQFGKVVIRMNQGIRSRL